MNTIEEVLLQATQVTYQGPEPLPILADGQPQNFSYRGTINVTVENYGGLTIGKEYLSPTRGFNISVTADRVGPISLVANRALCVVTIIEINAAVPTIVFDSACEPGGVGVHRVVVEGEQILPVRILKQGKANFFDFELTLTGEQPGELQMSQQGNALRILDEVIDHEGERIRLITISTRPGV
jgi:hypothetical protein